MFKWFGKVNFSPYTKVTDFAQHLKDGRLMGSRCRKCGNLTFPPRADCPECLSDRFEYRMVDRGCMEFNGTTYCVQGPPDCG